MPSDRPNEREDGVLSPTDLDIADSEYVAEIEDGRYVVSTDEQAPDPSSDERAKRSTTDAETARYSLDIEVGIDGDTATYQTDSDNIVVTFTDLVSWYATQVDSDLDPAYVLRILVAESDLAIGPRPVVETALDRYALDESDSIGALLEALSQE